jgi:hypothetical protein
MNELAEAVTRLTRLLEETLVKKDRLQKDLDAAYENNDALRRDLAESTKETK